MTTYKILTTFDGAEDGIHIKKYEKGQVLVLGKGIGPNMVAAGLKAGWIEQVEDTKKPAGEKATGPKENKAQGAAPKNKAVAPAEKPAA